MHANAFSNIPLPKLQLDLEFLRLFSDYESVLTFIELPFFSTDSPQSSQNHNYLTLKVFRTLLVLGLILKNQSNKQVANPAVNVLVHLLKERLQLSQGKQG